mmetsp:Transcript_9556/g.14362  ORF Transcript_9556/g.14362 Transcript_9556/m.14362 type:complete len:226 (-) Transcript_9556:339-1016(-)|eukprot:CAMPEP_0116022790 /NCGR_PEP_ID=MMETSP0321-20121206/11192_1 /TAXON_ID=163516 /ORGANISM="Leptocylindrus danicus var. danicus, Strain B650" /LENGTH=225 /DNA_ID=CAMNT_0003493919 /DNA_START=429 /DNA_END=1106 /DNA_ORIENTATION=+
MTVVKRGQATRPKGTPSNRYTAASCPDKTSYTFADQDARDNESLTYSVNSSSVASNTGESTDSSFGEFLRAVINDNCEPLTDREAELIQKGMQGGNTTIRAGQHTDSRLYDGGGLGNGSILFSPADQSDNVTNSKRQSRSSRRKQSRLDGEKRRSSKEQSNGVGASRHSKRTTTPPPPAPPKKGKDDFEHDQLWYSQWWMCGFADSLGLLSDNGKNVSATSSKGE